MNINSIQSSGVQQSCGQAGNRKQQVGFASTVNVEDIMCRITSKREAKKIQRIINNAANDGKNYYIKITSDSIFKLKGLISYPGEISGAQGYTVQSMFSEAFCGLPG